MKAAAVIALAALGLVCAGAGASRTPAPTCARGFAGRAPSGLPAPLIVQTACARFLVEPDGSVLAGPRAPLPRNLEGVPVDDQGWLVRRHHHLVLSHGRRLSWRSSGRFDFAHQRYGPAVVGGGALAFTYADRLYVSRLDGREHFVHRWEAPVGWSQGGELYTYAGGPRRVTLRVRERSGRLLGTIARDVGEFQFDYGSRTVVYERGGTLFRADGLRSHALARIGRHGFELLPGGMIGVAARDTMTLLRPDGRKFGVAPFVVPWVTPDSEGHVVSLVSGSSVYVMNAGGEARRVYHSPSQLDGCQGGVDVEWHRRWLLLNVTADGKVIAVDTAADHRVDLTRLIRHLPGNGLWPSGQTGLQAAWS